MRKKGDRIKDAVIGTLESVVFELVQAFGDVHTQMIAFNMFGMFTTILFLVSLGLIGQGVSAEVNRTTLLAVILSWIMSTWIGVLLSMRKWSQKR